MGFLEALTARRAYFVLAAVVVVLDQASKIAAHAHLRGRSAVEVVPGWFNLIYSRNPGGLFGYFGELGGPLRTVLLTLLPAVAVVSIVWYLARGEDLERAARLALGLILGGAVGNLIDRVARGEVVDFLDVYVSSPGAASWLEDRFGTAHWPTFNIADSAIVVGACLLVLDTFRPRRRERDDPQPCTRS